MVCIYTQFSLRPDGYFTLQESIPSPTDPPPPTPTHKKDICRIIFFFKEEEPHGCNRSITSVGYLKTKNLLLAP